MLSFGHIKVIDAGSGLKKERIYVFGGGQAADRAVEDTATYCLDLGKMMHQILFSVS